MISSVDEDVITAAMLDILRVNPFYFDVISWKEFKMYAIDEAEKDLIISRMNDSYLQSNLSTVLENEVSVTSFTNATEYNNTGCDKFYSTEVLIESFGSLTMFVSTERVHIRVNGPDRWFGLGFGSQMAGSDAIIFDGTDLVFDTKLGSYSQGYFTDEIDNLEKTAIKTQSDGGFTIDFWRDRDTGDVEGDTIIQCSDSLQMIWAKGAYTGEQISPSGHRAGNRAVVTVELSELLSVAEEVEENISENTYYSSRRDTQRLHAWIMIFAWLICIPTGVLSITIRRILYAQGRPLASWGDEGCLTNKFWFYMHLGFNSVAVILTAVGIFIVATLVDSHFTHSHGKIGLSILVLSVAQVISGILRPDKKNVSRRKFWVTVHRLLGVTLFIMAVINMYIAQWLDVLVFMPFLFPEFVLLYAGVVFLFPLSEFLFRTRVQRDTGLMTVKTEMQ